MKIKDLPKVIKDKAMPYIKQEFPIKKHRPKRLDQAFDWDCTWEGIEYWIKVNQGKFIEAEEMFQEEKKPFFLDEVLDIKVNAPEVVDPIVEKVREKLKQRSAVGIKKYGTTLDRNDLSLEQWLDHATEEAMDFCLYLTKIKEDLKNK
jgi:hypothetical protein